MITCAGLLIQHYGPACGMLTITSQGITAKEARKRCSRLMVHLKKHFPAHIGVLAPNRSGQPHLHLLVACTQDIRTGFDPVAYEELKELCHNAAEKQFRMSKELTKRMLQNPFLESLWGILKKEIVQADLGPRFWLIPILDCSTPDLRNQYVPEAAIKYLAQNYFDGVRANHKSGNRIRFLARSKGFPWPPRPKPDPKSLWQLQAKAVWLALGVSRDDLKDVFGPKWGLWFSDIFDDLTLYHTSDPENWRTVTIVETVFQYLQPRTDYFHDLKQHILANPEGWRRTGRDHQGNLVGQGRWDTPVPTLAQVPPHGLPDLPLSSSDTEP